MTVAPGWLWRAGETGFIVKRCRVLATGHAPRSGEARLIEVENALAGGRALSMGAPGGGEKD